MPAHFGLDIGSYSIKAVQAKKKGNKWQLVAAGETVTPIDINSNDPQARQKLIDTIKKLISEAQINTKEVAVSLPETSVFSQVIELPPLSSQELATAVDFEAEQYIPIPINEVELEYLVVERPPKGSSQAKMKVLLVAARKTTIDSMVSIVGQVGLTPIVMETEVLALSRLVNSSQRNVLILNLGYRSTELVISVGNTIRFIRTLNTGGEALTRNLARNLEMDVVQAEQYKNAYGLDQAQLEGRVAKEIIPALNIIVTEVKKTLAFFQQQNPNNKADLIVITGGGSAMRGLSAFLTNIVGLEVVVLDPFGNFVPNEKLKTISQRQQFGVAVGLAVREI